AVVVVCVIWFILGGGKHIEDTNGPDNFALTTITDKDIVKREMASLGLGEKSDMLTNTVTYYSDKYTGVSELYYHGYSTAGLEITVHHASVTEGNFCIAVVINDKIAHKFSLNELSQTYTLTEAGEVRLVIAGESAAFEFDFNVNLNIFEKRIYLFRFLSYK
ncbi:MAG: hypothetical protein IJA91_02295, partial [Clostridia bacterium]|nr:hypothetical protein [Clostridia bacterium]